LHINLSLFPITFASSFNLFMKTQFVPITFFLFSLGISSHVSFLSILYNYSSISLTQCSSLLASSKWLGSIVDNSARCLCSGECIILWVSTSASLFPKMCYGGQFFYTHCLGVLGCILCLYSSFSSSYSSSMSSSFRLFSSFFSSKSLLLSSVFHSFVSSFFTLTLSTIMLSITKNLYSFIFLEYPTSIPLSTWESNFPILSSSLLT